MDIRLIGVPIDLGANRRGVDMGPSALRYAGLQRELELLGHTVVDVGDLIVPGPEHREPGDPRARYLDEIVMVCRELAGRVSAVAEDGHFPIVMGGDHSMSVGTVSGVRRVHPNTGVIWLDAHGDFNTPETTPSGNVHGMSLAAIVGLGAPELVACMDRRPVRPEQTALIGVRDLDEGERNLLQETGVLVFTMQEVDRLGLTTVMERALARLQQHTDAIHLSLDLDVFEPDLAPGVGTPKSGGFTYREGHLAMELIAELGMLVSMEIVEVNPILDEANRTAKLAVDMARSALGARVF